MSELFDAIIIGAGQAGPSLAGRLTDAGMTLALIERKLFGGTCVKQRSHADQHARRQPVHAQNIIRLRTMSLGQYRIA